MPTLKDRLPSLLRLVATGMLWVSGSASAQLITSGPAYSNDIVLTSYTATSSTTPAPDIVGRPSALIRYNALVTNAGPGTVTAADNVAITIHYSSLNLNEFNSVPGDPPWRCGVVGSLLTPPPSTSPPTHVYKRCVYTGPDVLPGAAFPPLSLDVQSTGPGPTYVSRACAGALTDPFPTPDTGVNRRPDPNPANDCGEVTVVDPAATVDLVAAKRAISGAAPALGTGLPAAIATVALGADFNWVVDLVNNGPGEALSNVRTTPSPASGLGVVVTDTLPAGATVTGPITWSKAGTSATIGAVVTGTGTCTSSGVTVTCNMGDMANGGTARIVIPVRYTTWPGGAGATSDPQTNSAVVATQRPDTADGNNTAASVVRVTRAQIAGTVYIDAGNTGLITGNPGRISGVTLELRQGGTSCSDGTVLGSTTTAVDGTYSFPGGTVSAGQVTPGAAYRICQVQPTGFNDGSTNPGTGNSTPVPNAILIPALASGGSIDNNFGELRLPSTISGLVYVDRARSGVLSPANPGRIAGVTMELRTGATSCSGGGSGTLLGSTTTTADGRYSFPGGSVTAIQVTSGTDYLICQTQPAAYLDGSTNPPTGNTSTVANSIAIASLPGVGSPDNNFGELAGRIAGVVYEDFGTATAANRDNGVRDVGERGIVNVPVTLTNTGTGTTLGPVASASDGSYAFEDLPAGTYVVTEGAIPAASGIYSQGRTTVGTIAAAATGTAGVDTITAIALPAGGVGINYNFGELPAPTTISGLVYIDRARGGVLAGNPGRLPDVTLELRTGATSCTTGTVLGTTTTGPDGSYAFPGGTVTAPQVIAGSAYLICQVQPAAYADGTANPGTGNTTPAANSIAVPALPSGGSPANNFGELPARISGVVYQDYGTATAANRDNGVRDAAELGIANVPVTLTNTSTGTTLAPVLTAADGSYAFDDLPAGTYTVTQGVIPPASGTYVQGRTTVGTVAGSAVGTLGTDTITAIALPAGGVGINYNFGELPPPPSISGLVYIDQARSGVLSPANPGRVPGVTIELRTGGTSCTSGTVVSTTTTAADGSYRFGAGGATVTPALAAGTAYRICQVQPAAFGDGSTNAGPGNTSPAPNSVLIAALPEGSSPDNHFGEIPLGPDLVVTKAMGTALLTETGTGRYTLTVRNNGPVATSGTVTVTDTLPAGLSATASTTATPNPRGTGWACTVAGQTVTCTSTDVIAAGATSANTITLDVTVGTAVCAAGSYPCDLVNRVSVSGGGEQAPQAPSPSELATPPLCTATATQNACRLATPVQQPGGVSGLAWFDGDVDRQFGSPADVRLPGIVVELLQNGSVLRTVTTNAQGEYLITGLIPGAGYEIRFRDPVTGGYYGRPVSRDPAGGNDPSAVGGTGVVAGGTIRNITIPGGNAVRLNQNLPLDPSGVVYDSQTREPVSGAVVEFLGPTSALVPAQCVVGGVNRMTTAGRGSGTAVPGGYGFWLITPAPAGCPGDATYRIRVTPPPGYLNAGIASDGSATSTSAAIPAQTRTLTPPGDCTAGSAVAGRPCTVQAQPTPPALGQPTPYFFAVPVAPNTPASFLDIVNNHIPVDPLAGSRFVITKQAGRSTADVGDVVPYTITVRSVQGPALPNVRVDDRLPAGFRYVPGTFRVSGLIQADPAGAPGPNLRFPIGTVPAGGTVTFTYALRLGVGSQQGDGINRAQATSTSGTLVQQSNVAQARVRVTGGVFSNETCVVGKVYVDCNNNQVQDPEELGIPGVRVVLQDGTGRISDSEGKYSFCGLPPRTHVLKVDRLTMPRGSRIVTSSNRNAGDGHSIFIDAKNGELQRADFIEGSCSNTVLEQTKARRMTGEVRAPETEKRGAPALKFEGRPATAPQQATDSANQIIVKPREPSPNPSAPVTPSNHEQNLPVPQLPAASPATQRPTPPPTPGAAAPGTSR